MTEGSNKTQLSVTEPFIYSGSSNKSVLRDIKFSAREDTIHNCNQYDQEDIGGAHGKEAVILIIVLMLIIPDEIVN